MGGVGEWGAEGAKPKHTDYAWNHLDAELFCTYTKQIDTPQRRYFFLYSFPQYYLVCKKSTLIV